MEPSRPRPPRPRPEPPLRPEPAPEPKRRRDVVEIPRAWLPPLVGGVVLVLLLVAYLLGKEAGRREPGLNVAEAPAHVVPLATPTPTPAASVEIPGVTYQPPTPLTPGFPQADGQPRAAVPALVAGAAAPQGNPRSSAVAAYFAEIEGYERQAKYWSNPQELAMSLVGQGAQGDTSGLQRLLETQRTAQRQIESMTVPHECREHHRRTLSILSQAGDMLAEVEQGMATGNLEGLLGLSGQARQLETETRQIDALAQKLKSQYGVAGS